MISPQGDAEMGTWMIAGVRWEANAHLIAAAPDMLFLLQRLREWDQLPHTGDGPFWIREIDKALAKAEAK